MTERASVYQALQIGLESEAGTPDDADILLQSISLDPAIKSNVKIFKPVGQKFNTFAMPGKEWTELKIGGYATYDELLLLLSSALVLVEPTADGDAKLWTLAPANSEEDAVATFTVQQGNSDQAHEIAYCMVTDLSLTFSRDEVTVGGTMIGTALDETGTMDATPGSLAAVPILPKDVCVYLADTQAELDAADELERALRVSVNMSNLKAPIWSLLCTSASWSGVVETAPKIEVKLLMAADAVGIALLDHLRAGTSQFMRIAAESDVEAATGKTYTFNLDMALLVSNVSDFHDEDGLFALEWTFEVEYDPTWTYAIEAIIRNAMATLDPPVA